jgi:gamma-glutamyl hercynylcysteine S-oxide synthase
MTLRYFAALFVMAGVFLAPGPASAQVLHLDAADGLRATSFSGQAGQAQFSSAIPLFSMVVDGTTMGSDEAEVTSASPLTIRFSIGLEAHVEEEASPRGWKANVTFRNVSSDTLRIENVVPFGASRDRVHITAAGPWSLARTRLFRPGKSPVGVILPDNAWEMGYGAVDAEGAASVAAIARRTDTDSAQRTRWHTDVNPGGSVTYTFWADEFQGEWQNGLRLMFRDRYLYDLDEFDNALFERDDLAWIHDQYLIALQMSWDREFVDSESGRLQYDAFFDEAERFMGGYDIYGLWPTWPRLGLDQRNQWDMYRDLPGGMEGLQQLARDLRDRGTRFFIAYNPWDEDTRDEDHMGGMAELIRDTDADGVILDTKGESSYELQAAADGVRPGVVMFSEGMAVPQNMPGIVSGRVHDAIVMPPPLNLNRLIKPDFAIYRVGQLRDGDLRRDANVSLFNGHGMEINTFFPGRLAQNENDYRHLGRTTRILRENSSAFQSHEWTPLYESLRDSVWINKWPEEDKTVFTILSKQTGGHEGALFAVDQESDVRYVDLWRNVEINPDTIDGRLFIPVSIDPYPVRYRDTRLESMPSVVAAFQRSLEVALVDDSLTTSATRGTRVAVWAGDPSYEKQPLELGVGRTTVSLLEHLGPQEGKFVVQLFDQDRLIDQTNVDVEQGTPRLITHVTRTAPSASAPSGMVHVPGGTIAPTLKDRGRGNSGIVTYPSHLKDGRQHDVGAFYIDRYPVTNADFARFLQQTGYRPADTTNFLRHWVGNRVPEGLERHPVVYVSLGDVRAYADWAGKRLPTEAEWQLAAQGTDGRAWPWGAEFDSTRANSGLGHTTPVDAYPQGASPFGVEDLVGNVWQITNDVYDDGSYRFAILRGGSHYQPTSSWWYVEGGPIPLDQRQSLLLVGPSFDRNATVGFRLVTDVAQR